MMQIVNGQHPPNIVAIDAKFNVKDKKGILYCHGDFLYNPDSVPVSDWILTHEIVHSVRQSDMGVDLWWERYIQSNEFRLDEEIRAHRAEWSQFVELNKDRNLRSKYLHFMCQRLAGPLYDNMLKVSEAKQRIAGL